MRVSVYAFALQMLEVSLDVPRLEWTPQRSSGRETVFGGFRKKTEKQQLR